MPHLLFFGLRKINLAPRGSARGEPILPRPPSSRTLPALLPRLLNQRRSPGERLSTNLTPYSTEIPCHSIQRFDSYNRRSVWGNDIPDGLFKSLQIYALRSLLLAPRAEGLRRNKVHEVLRMALRLSLMTTRIMAPI